MSSREHLHRKRRHRTPRALTGLALAGALLAAGCTSSATTPNSGGSTNATRSTSGGPAPTSGGTTEARSETWLIPQDWGALDPTQEAATNMGTILLVMEPLVIANGKGGVISNLATEGHPSPTTWTYTLRSGAKFSDGKPVTMADVLYSFEIHTAKGSKSNLAGNFSNVKSVTAHGSTLTITLTAPDVLFPNYVAEVGIVEKAVREKDGSNPGTPGHLNVGSGPYVVSSYTPGNQVVLTRNPNYWGQPASVETLTLRLIQDDSARLLAVQGGGVTGAFEIPASEVPVYQRISGMKVIHGGNDSVLTLNVNNTQKPWNDPDVRKAVAMAIDKDGIVKAVLQGNGHATPSIVDQTGAATELGSAGAASLYNKLAAMYPYNVDAAKVELAKSSVPHGFSGTLIYSQAEQTSGLVAQAVAQELKAIGINLTVKSVPDSQYTNEVFFKHTAPPAIVDFGTDIPDPVSLANYMSNSSGTLAKGGYTDIAEYANPEQDKLLNQYVALPADATAQRGALLQKALTNLTDDEPYIPIYFADYTAAINSNMIFNNFDSFWYLRRWINDVTGN